MPQIIYIKDYDQEIEIPDGADMAQVQAALKKQFPPKKEEARISATGLVSAMPTLPTKELPAPPGQLTRPPGEHAEQITQLLSALVTGGASGVAATIPKGMSLLRPPGALSGPLSRMLRPATQELKGFKFPGPSRGSLKDLRTEAQEAEQFFRHMRPGTSQLPETVQVPKVGFLSKKLSDVTLKEVLKLIGASGGTAAVIRFLKGAGPKKEGAGIRPSGPRIPEE